MKIISDEQFVRAWRKSRCVDDMISYTGLSRNRIYIRARELRKLGVTLPFFFDIQRHVDVGKLNEILRGGA